MQSKNFARTWTWLLRPVSGHYQRCMLFRNDSRNDLHLTQLLFGRFIEVLCANFSSDHLALLMHLEASLSALAEQHRLGSKADRCINKNEVGKKESKIAKYYRKEAQRRNVKNGKAKRRKTGFVRRKRKKG